MKRENMNIYRMAQENSWLNVIFVNVANYIKAGNLEQLKISRVQIDGYFYALQDAHVISVDELFAAQKEGDRMFMIWCKYCYRNSPR